MQLAYQVPLLQLIAGNTNHGSDPFRVPVGSHIRILVVVAAIVGAPAGYVALRFYATDGTAYQVWGQGVPAAGTWFADFTLATEFIDFYFLQAGGVNTSTITIEVIISPPDSTPA